MMRCSSSYQRGGFLIDREIVATRLSKLRDNLRKLRKVAAKPQDEYLSSDTEKALAEHYLRLSLEAMLDTGNHVIAVQGYRKPLKLREIPIILAENGVIPRELANKMSHATGLRNRLVHGYTDIDHETIYSILQNDLGDLEAFAIAIGRFVVGEGGD
jgi:uncharacterized protein YutE (UPF0331/DUF86 family)